MLHLVLVSVTPRPLPVATLRDDMKLHWLKINRPCILELPQLKDYAGQPLVFKEPAFRMRCVYDDVFNDALIQAYRDQWLLIEVDSQGNPIAPDAAPTPAEPEKLPVEVPVKYEVPLTPPAPEKPAAPKPTAEPEAKPEAEPETKPESSSASEPEKPESSETAQTEDTAKGSDDTKGLELKLKRRR